MIRYLFLSGLLLLLVPERVLPCDCDYGGSFLKMSEKAALVALIKVSKYLTFKDINGVRMPMSMEVEIVDIYKGREIRNSVTVWGDIGNLCRPYLSVFKENEYYVISFHPGSFKGGHLEEKKSDYSIFICGAYWLNVDFRKHTATGDIDSPDRTNRTEKLRRIKAELSKPKPSQEFIK